MGFLVDLLMARQKYPLRIKNSTKERIQVKGNYIAKDELKQVIDLHKGEHSIQVFNLSGKELISISLSVNKGVWLTINEDDNGRVTYNYV